MARSDLVRRLFASYMRADDAGFRRAAQELVDDERRKNHRLLANELERELHADRGPGADLPLTLRPIPKSRDERPLLHLGKPKHDLSELVLAPEADETVAAVIEDNRARAALTGHGLRPRQRLLLVGPPGTGKSAAAHAIAAELSLPVATVSLAALTSSFLGDTARNIEAVIAFAEHTPCVLLLDEFDVLGQERGQAGDHGEMRRVAATVLQTLENFHGESIVVTTSNHPNLLDSAMWRRFDELIGFGSLNQAQVATLISVKLRAVRSGISTRSWAKTLHGLGLQPAEVEMVCLDAMRRSVLSDRDRVDDAAMSAAVDRMCARRRMSTDQPNE